MFTELQRDFAQALFDPARSVPEDISAYHGHDPARRFNIYRNNVAAGLIDALAARFPVTLRIVGGEFFNAMAHVFIKAHPPSSPLMMFYGDDFPAFISSFEPAAELIYLADLAKLEAARTRAYHAQDATPLAPSALQSLKADDLVHLRLKLHPSLEIVSSVHPIVTIWDMHSGSISPGEISDWHSEDALVARPHLDVEVRRLPPGGGAFLHGLAGGRTVPEAAESALAEDAQFDLGINLAGLFTTGLAISLSII